MTTDNETAEAEIIEIVTTGVAHGGYCVGRHEGIAVFVTGALPGERVRARVVDKRSRLWFARTVDVIEASPDRVNHVWPLAERAGIGGADLGHVRLSAQREWKARVIKEQLSRIAHIDTEVTVEAAAGDDGRGGLGWRTRVEFTTDGSGRLSMYEPHSQELVPVDSMPLAVDAITQSAPWDSAWPADCRVLIAAPSIPGPDGQTTYGSWTPLRSQKPRRSATIRERVDTVWGSDTYDVALDGFWQRHREAPKILVDAVLGAATLGGDIAGATVWDLYAGAGLFSAPLCRALGSRGKLLAVEGDERAAGFCEKNLQTATTGAVFDVVAGDTTAVLNARVPVIAGGAGEHADIVVLDPPRSGAGKKSIDAITRANPDIIVYVSCDPAALARDLGYCGEHGYHLSALRAFDLYPHTHHVECVAVCENRKSAR